MLDTLLDLIIDQKGIILVSKSLTSTHASLLQEREKLESKIKTLESQLGDGIIALIRKNNGFNIPYPILCGAILETLQTIETKKDKHLEWQQQGEKFLRLIQQNSLSSHKKKSKKDITANKANDNIQAA